LGRAAVGSLERLHEGSGTRRDCERVGTDGEKSEGGDKEKPLDADRKILSQKGKKEECMRIASISSSLVTAVWAPVRGEEWGEGGNREPWMLLINESSAGKGADIIPIR